MGKLLSLSPGKAEPAYIEEAAHALRDGKLVAFPTETVYGLGANALSDKAVAAIFEAKGRPSFNPLIVHVAALDALENDVVLNTLARELATSFWPGPLTLVLPKKAGSKISLLCSAGLDCLAVRIPAHPVAQALLKKAAVPVAAPSANRSGKISSTTPLHVLNELGERVDIILGAGRCPIGVESTILDLTQSPPLLLRPGGISLEQLESVIGKVALPQTGTQQPKAPGQLESHYAPKAQVRLNATHAQDNEALLAFGPDMGIKGGAPRFNLSPNGDLTEAAANLFAMLHEADKAGAIGIAVMPIPETGLGLAINDRLRRAAAPRPENGERDFKK